MTDATNAELNASPRTDEPSSEPTLLPMLVAGLVLIVVGAGVVMSFV